MTTALQALSVTPITLRKWCVYAHLLHGEVVYIGKGNSGRPFIHAGRTPRWTERMTSVSTLDVAILGWFDSARDALKAESRLIQRYQPELNCMGIPGRFNRFWHESRRNPVSQPQTVNRPDLGRIVLQVRFRHSIIVRVDARARREGLTRAGMMRRILAEQLVREEGLDRGLGV